MRNKLTIILFGLLLAVGWTNTAQAQLLPMPKGFMTRPDFKETKQTKVSSKSLQSNSETMCKDAVFAAKPIDGESTKSNAPRRADYTVVADKVHKKSWYEDLGYYPWYDESVANPTAQYAKLTEPASNPYQIWSLLRVAYASEDIPGIRYSEPYGSDHDNVDLPYDGADFGWYVSGDITEDITIDMTGGVNLQYVKIYDFEGNLITSYDAQTTTLNNLPSGWTRNTEYNSSGYYYLQRNSSGYIYWRDDYGLGYQYYQTALTISKNLFKGKGGVIVELSARRTAADPSNFSTNYTDFYGTYQHRYVAVNRSKHGKDFILKYNTWDTYTAIVHGPVTPPKENGYSVFIVKLKDKDKDGNVFNNDINVLAPEYTESFDELIDYLDTYVDEVQLLTDGLRVGQDDGNGGLIDAGTMFSYTGTLNRFFFISKGKMATYGSTQNQWGWYSTTYNNTSGYYTDYYSADRAPFYAMYEEFSPTTQDNTTGIGDFYAAMVDGETHDIKHDCRCVTFMQHYFAMNGKAGTDPKSVSSLVFFIPDNRGQNKSDFTDDVWGTEYRNYNPDYQPRVGLYTIRLNAEAVPTPNHEGYYTINVTWESSLSGIVDNQVPETFDLYEVIYDENGNIVEYNYIGTYDDTFTYTTEVEQTETSFTRYYQVKGHPTKATNPDYFYTWSNIKDVTIPGTFDFMKLEKDHVESDFVIAQQKNFYRNYLYPTNLAPNTGMTMEQLKQEWPADQTAKYTLYRDNQGIAVLEIRAVGKKVYYRIKYYKATQEPNNLPDVQYINQNK